MILTFDELKSMEPSSTFARGERLTEGHWIKWVARRGGANDWAVYHVDSRYADLDDWPWERIERQGDKLLRSTAAELVQCTEECLSVYRD